MLIFENYYIALLNTLGSKLSFKLLEVVGLYSTVVLSDYWLYKDYKYYRLTSPFYWVLLTSFLPKPKINPTITATKTKTIVIPIRNHFMLETSLVGTGSFTSYRSYWDF